MTELLYLSSDAPILESHAVIEQIIAENNRIALVLDKTPFYPEGGGQPADFGLINGYAVIDVQKNNAEVYHYLDLETVPSELKVGVIVLCQVDEVRRLDLTEQHTGQHLLSSLAFNHMEAHTVGFHLSDTYTTIDLDKKLQLSDVQTLEKLVFKMISANKTIRSEYPDSESLDNMPLRKQPKVSEDIRVIVIDGTDHSPCGGTHLSFTKDIVGIKITKFENYKGGTRLEFVCGRRFIEAIQQQSVIVDQLTKKLSASQESILEAYAKKEAQLNALKLQVDSLQNELIDIEVNQWVNDLEEELALGEYTPVHFRLMEDKSLDYMKKLSQVFLEKEPRVGIFIISQAGESAQFIFNRHKNLDQLNCKAILAKAGEKFAVKGGGAPTGVQGSLVNASETDAFIEYIEQLI